jgi:hypothetical protein
VRVNPTQIYKNFPKKSRELPLVETPGVWIMSIFVLLIDTLMKFLLGLASIVAWLFVCILLFNATETKPAEIIIVSVILIGGTIGYIYLLRRSNREKKQDNPEN